MNSENRGAIHHHECQELMHSFVNGRLDNERQRQVQEHVAFCAECFSELQHVQAISDGIKAAPAELDELLATSRMEKNLQDLLDSKDDANGRADQQPTNLVWLSEWRDNWRKTPSRTRSLVWLQAACLVLAVVLLMVGQQFSGAVPVPSGEYITLSDPQVKQGSGGEDYQVYRIIFHPASTEADIRSLMNAVGTQIISGPSVSGVYTISSLKKAPQQVLILQKLRASPWVKLAEPSIQNSIQNKDGGLLHGES